MTTRTTAVYIAGGALLVAYFAAANMPSQGVDRGDERARPDAAVPTATLADEVHAQAVRLHDRMAQAPAPENSARNPFSFAPPPRAARPAHTEVRAATVEAAPPPFVPPPPALTLMGIAEEFVIGGFRRTAVIGGDGDAVFIVTEGQQIGERYKVTKIGADAIELEDLVTKGYRRMALR